MFKGNKIHTTTTQAEHRCDVGAGVGLPPGLGVLVVGVDRVTVEERDQQGNDSVGVAVLDWCIVLDGTDFDCATNPLIYQPAPDNNLVRKNDLREHTATIRPPGIFAALAGDLALVSFAIHRSRRLADMATVSPTTTRWRCS